MHQGYKVMVYNTGGKQLYLPLLIYLPLGWKGQVERSK